MPNPYFRVSLKGRLGSQEVWSVNPIFDPVGEPGTYSWVQEEGDAAAQGIAALTFGPDLRGIWGSTTSLTSVRVEARDDQTDDLLGVSEYQLPTPITGTTAASKTPQTALVASLRTNTPGAAGRGRLYWPALSIAINASDFTLPTATSVAVATATAALLRAIAEELREAFAVNPGRGSCP